METRKPVKYGKWKPCRVCPKCPNTWRRESPVFREVCELCGYTGNDGINDCFKTIATARRKVYYFIPTWWDLLNLRLFCEWEWEVK